MRNILRGEFRFNKHLCGSNLTDVLKCTNGAITSVVVKLFSCVLMSTEHL